jgi:DNA-binding LacI/PurR family transcriptional regulator
MRAIGFMEAAKEMNIEIPNDISVVGIDDIAELYPATPPLTTIRLQCKSAGRKLVESLVNMAKNGTVATVKVKTVLKKNRTVKKVEPTISVSRAGDRSLFF